MADFVKKGQAMRADWANTITSDIRSLQGFKPRRRVLGTGGGAGSGDIKPFGEVFTQTVDDETAKYIRGGLILCGESNITVPPQEISNTADSDKLVYISITCISNRDDDNQIFLPGLESGTEPSGNWPTVTYSESAQYPDNTNPGLESGSGTIILPIGRLRIQDGVIKLFPIGSGNFVIGQCAGTLSFTRQ